MTLILMIDVIGCSVVPATGDGAAEGSECGSVCPARVRGRRLSRRCAGRRLPRRPRLHHGEEGAGAVHSAGRRQAPPHQDQEHSGAASCVSAHTVHIKNYLYPG